MQEVLYEVFETNADLLAVKLVHQGFSKDVAETKTVKCFTNSDWSKDYMLLNHNTQELIFVCFSTTSLMKRGECSQ